MSSAPRARRGRRAIAVAAAALVPVAAAALPAACSGSAVDVALADAANLRKGAAFVELLVYESACPSLEALSRGEIGAPKVRRVAKASGDLPELGELPQGPHGVAALLRDEGCAVIASGCADADFADVRKVVVPLGAVVPPQGACAAGGACVDAVCVGGTDAGKADAGKADAGGGDAGKADAASDDAGASDAGQVDAAPGDAASPDAGSTACKLGLVAAGALPGLIDATGGTITGPGVTATSSGFLVAYREASHDGAASTAALVSVGDDGKLGLPSRQVLVTCAGVDPASDGVAVAENGGAGLVVVSRAACGQAGAGVLLLSFDASNQLGAATPSADLGAAVVVPRAHGLAARKGGFDAALLVDGAAVLASIGAGSITKQPFFAPATTSSFAGLAMTAGSRATIADRATNLGGETVLGMVSLAAPVGDAGAPAPLLALRPPSPWAALAAWEGPAGDRAAALTVEPGGAAAWGAVDRDGTSRGAGSVPAGDGGTYASGDLAVLDDRVLVALAQPGAIRVHRLVGAQGDGLSAEGAPVAVAGAGVPPLDAFDGARVAVAAARGRLLVVWITKHAIGPGEPTGGYALLACDG